jgi:hypothetical protein
MSPPSSIRKIIIIIIFFFFFFFIYGGVTVFDHLDVLLNVSYEFLIFGSFSSLGCRRIAPWDNRGLTS